MGLGTRDREIRTFWPDDDENTLYLDVSMWSGSAPSLHDLIKHAELKWGYGCYEHVKVSAEHIHTDCLGYDRYDSSDYTDFIVLTKISQQ